MANGTEIQSGDDFVTIPREEYDKLVEKVATINIIEEAIHKPELSEEIKKELAEARKVPDSELIDHDEVKKRLGIE